MKKTTRSSFSKDRQTTTNEKNPFPSILSAANSSKLPPLVKQMSVKNPVKMAQRQDDFEEEKNNETNQNIISSGAIRKPSMKVVNNISKPPISQAKTVQNVAEKGTSSRLIGSSQSGKRPNSINNNEKTQKSNIESLNVQDKVSKTNKMMGAPKNTQQSSQKDVQTIKGTVGNRLGQNVQNKRNLEEKKIKQQQCQSNEEEEEKEELIEQIAIPVRQQFPTKRGELKLRTHERIEHRKEIRAEKTREKILLERVNYHIYRKILCFSASSYREVAKMMLVCKRFRAVIMSCYEIWECVLRSLPKSIGESFIKSQSYQGQKGDTEAEDELQEKKGIVEIKEYVEIESKKKVIRQMDAFFAEYRKLFEYCSTKENIASKMLDKLQLKVRVIMNNKERSGERNVKVGSANFHSRIVLKLPELNQILLLHLDFLNIQIRFYSAYLQKTVVLTQKFSVKRIIDAAVYQRAFAYYADQNFLICFFHGDQSFLYALFEISAMQLVQLFREKLEQSLIYSQKSLLKVEATKKQLKILSKDLSKFSYDSFSQYFSYQSDFEIMVSVHNTAKEDLYKFIDTRCFPVERSETSASFMFSPGDRIFVENVFALDNKAGMKENVSDLLLLDLILKDRDRFLVCFSGFVAIKEMADISHKNSVNMNMDYSTADDYAAKIIEISQPKHYNFEMVIIQTKREAVLKSMRITLFPGIIVNNLPLSQQSI